MQSGFDTVLHGKQVMTHTLSNEHLQATITNYGCRIVQLLVKKENYLRVSVVFGYNTLDEYLTTKEFYHGAVIGRYANRISKGRFSLGGKDYQLATNNGPNHLHGGPKGFHDQVWDIVAYDSNSITLSYISEDGEEGYPGRLQLSVTYTIKNNDLVIDYIAQTTTDTVINFTNHAYFNLNGTGSGKVTQHQLLINAGHITPVDETLIPTGQLMPVDHTPFDFRQGKTIGEDINADYPQIKIGNGYDHNFALNKTGSGLETAAIATGDETGITLEVLTTEPGMQLYVDDDRKLFCLETQHFPDSPNQPNFPTTLLAAGETFTSKTVFRFSVKS